MDNLNNDILVSVAIITYNHSEFISQTLESVISQETDFNYEIIVADDCSNDGSQKIIESFYLRFPDVIYPIYRDHNIGGLRNILDVYSRCSGKYIAHLDGDDLMLDGKLKKQVDIMENDPELSICCHKVYVSRDSSGSVDYRNIKQSSATKYRVYDVGYLLLNGPFFAHCSKMFRRNAMPSKGFLYEKGLKGLDWSFHVQNAMQGNIAYMYNDILGVYRKHCGGVTNSISNVESILLGHQHAVKCAERSGVVGRDVIKDSYFNLYKRFSYQYLLGYSFDNFRLYLSMSEACKGDLFVDRLLCRLKNYNFVLACIVFSYKRYKHIMRIVNLGNEVL